jgi:hypothetical protein
VGLNLPRLAEQPGLAANATLYLHKLGSLARMAMSAGRQKREFLRRYRNERPGIFRGFLLDRARLLVSPIGLEAVARHFTGHSISEGGAGLTLARQVIARLREALDEDGRHSYLEACLDSPINTGSSDSDTLSSAAGLSPWDELALPRQLIGAAGELHAIAGSGSLALMIGRDPSPTPTDVIDWLRHAWQHSDVVRLRLVRPSRPRSAEPIDLCGRMPGRQSDPSAPSCYEVVTVLRRDSATLMFSVMSIFGHGDSYFTPTAKLVQRRIP